MKSDTGLVPASWIRWCDDCRRPFIAHRGIATRCAVCDPPFQFGVKDLSYLEERM